MALLTALALHLIATITPFLAGYDGVKGVRDRKQWEH